MEAVVCGTAAAETAAAAVPAHGLWRSGDRGGGWMTGATDEVSVEVEQLRSSKGMRDRQWETARACPGRNVPGCFGRTLLLALLLQ